MRIIRVYLILPVVTIGACSVCVVSRGVCKVVVVFVVIVVGSPVGFGGVVEIQVFLCGCGVRIRIRVVRGIFTIPSVIVGLRICTLILGLTDLSVESGELCLERCGELVVRGRLCRYLISDRTERECLIVLYEDTSVDLVV